MEGKILKSSMLLLAVLLLCSTYGAADSSRLKLATTTSLHDSGLLDAIKPAFEKEYNVSLDIISVGSGQAIQYGQRGDVDVLLVHDKNAELQFVQGGYGLERRCVGYNYFEIVGPKNDPAGIKGMNATAAFKTIMEKGKADPSKVMFVSRGDNSGTYSREKQIWKNAGLDYSQVNNSGPWYIDAGQGMGATLMIANSKNAYTISDTSTFMAYSKKYTGNFMLVPLIEGGDDLLNVYTAIAVSPKNHPGVNCELANKFINYLVSDEGQNLIANFGKDLYGQALFFAAKGNCTKIGCSAAECAVPTTASCGAA
ncbi:MAG: substrate-binding domain-containing protein [Methanotrichaceae archaeon]